jgi:choline dehydrogenase-like flavoprotein
MIISPNRNARPLSYSFVAAARRAGLGEQPHYNGGAYQGAWICELAHKNGKRFSAYDAFLKPAMRRRNLEVITGVHATRVVLQRRRARGVAVYSDGVEKVFAANGVVLAAGAFGSPQLLMLSGVGSAAMLEALGIPVCYDAPEVGMNLQDHPILPMVFRARGTDTFKNAESPLNLLRYLLLKRGMLASNGCEAFAFAQARPSPSSAPDLELIFLPLDFRDQFLEPPEVHAFGIGVAVVAPHSRGRITLKNTDPLAAPSIDFGLLSDPDGIDASVLWAGVRLSRKIANTAPLEADNARELRPGAAVESDSDLLGYACTTLQTVYHPTSTCRMGSDSRAVVDPQLRVRGVDGLWVVDASVMPSVPRGHPNAVVAMIAHRAAQWVEAIMVR